MKEIYLKTKGKPRFRLINRKYYDYAMAMVFILILGLVIGIIDRAREPEFLSPVADPMIIVETEIVKEPDIISVGSIVDKVHALESSRGKAEIGHHVYCKSLGMSNEYGYGVRNKMCFRNHEEAKAMVYRWFNDKMETLSLPESLCLYNTGYVRNDCKYYQDYLSL